MKFSVKDSDIGYAREKRLCHFDSHEICRVVKRRKGDIVLDGLFDAIVNKYGRPKGFSTLDNTVANGADLGYLLNNTGLCINYPVYRQMHSMFMVFYLQFMGKRFFTPCENTLWIRAPFRSPILSTIPPAMTSAESMLNS